MTWGIKARGARNSLVLALWVALYLALVSLGFGRYITDQHGFRQTQTAISAAYLSDVADLVSYQTPVLGPPWAVPFEFPLYQALAQLLHRLSGLDLVPSGRLVAVGFFLLCAWPLSNLLARWRVSHPAWAMAPVWLCPLYTFWSRSFMIETTALFFALAYLSGSLSLLQGPRPGAARVAWTACAGVLAGLVKVTTLLPLWCLLSGLVVARSVAQRGTGQAAERVWPMRRALLLSQAVVAAAAVAWTTHADRLKAGHPLGAGLTSEALRTWNFGTLEQRLDPVLWFDLLGRSLDIVAPVPDWPDGFQVLQRLCTVLLLGTLFWACSPVRQRWCLVLLALYLAPILVFFNLHWVHSYDQCANAVFLCLAIGLAATGAIDQAPLGRPRRIRQLGFAVFLLSLVLHSATQFARWSSHEGGMRQLTELVVRWSDEQAVVIISGQNWSPVLPFQANRRALMLPDHATAAQMQAALANWGRLPKRRSVYVACGHAPLAEQAVRLALALIEPPAATVNGCTVYRLAP